MRRGVKFLAGPSDRPGHAVKSLAGPPTPAPSTSRVSCFLPVPKLAMSLPAASKSFCTGAHTARRPSQGLSRLFSRSLDRQKLTSAALSGLLGLPHPPCPLRASPGPSAGRRSQIRESRGRATPAPASALAAAPGRARDDLLDRPDRAPRPVRDDDAQQLHRLESRPDSLAGSTQRLADRLVGAPPHPVPGRERHRDVRPQRRRRVTGHVHPGPISLPEPIRTADRQTPRLHPPSGLELPPPVPERPLAAPQGGRAFRSRQDEGLPGPVQTAQESEEFQGSGRQFPERLDRDPCIPRAAAGGRRLDNDPLQETPGGRPFCAHCWRAP